MKKIISYSLWGSNPLYTDGIIWNAENYRRFYPDWMMRVYHDRTVPAATIEALKSIGVEIVPMPEAVDCIGLFWRFRPMFDDKEIERFIVRDSDSKIFQREVDAVNYWIETGKPLHIIRDCESHDIPILGGTWGAIPGCIPQFEYKMAAFIAGLSPCYENPRGLFHGTDQFFLQNAVWPILVRDHVAHIRAGISKLRFTSEDIELPELINNEYVGRVG